MPPSAVHSKVPKAVGWGILVVAVNVVVVVIGTWCVYAAGKLSGGSEHL